MSKKLVTIRWESTQEVDLPDETLASGDLVGFEFLQGITPDKAHFVSAHVSE